METTWIDIKDRMPEKGVSVIVCEMKFGVRYPIIGIGELDINGKWFYNIGDGDQEEDYNHNYRSITYWMPLPEPPKD